ncbi:MAG: TlpA disulfide reductase family protein [Bdellovibrionales bacterium]|jgi:thiol-disulfide isomerase/thioredoxin|nr:TlpA disulfide reductase family protein [Bdellovibrionales bacterium]
MLKPQQRIFLMVGAMVLAIGLSVVLLWQIQPEVKTDTQVVQAAAQEQAQKSARPSQAGKVLPGAVFYDAEGNAVSLADFKGSVVLVNLWATWCPPCVAELPALDGLQAKLRDNGLVVLPISLDRKPVEEVAAFLAERRVERMALYIDTDRQIPMKWTYAGIPASFLIGRDGVVIEQFDGPREWDEGAVFKHIAKLVSEQHIIAVPDAGMEAEAEKTP